MPNIRLTKIDESTRGDHYYLNDSDRCYFLYEYTSGGGWGHSDGNQLIANLKKTLDSHAAALKYKSSAIRQCAKDLQGAMGLDALQRYTFVPVPPSKTKDDPLYDDRMLKVCRGLHPGGSADVRELITQTASTRSSHLSGGNRVTIEDLASVYKFDRRLANSQKISCIAVVDDVLTTGTHFKAMQKVLDRELPQTRVIGIFVARRALTTASDEFSVEE